jgi:hypothetical protein
VTVGPSNTTPAGFAVAGSSIMGRKSLGVSQTGQVDDRGAAWHAIVGLSGEYVGDIARHAILITQAQATLDADDASGQWWTAGTLREGRIIADEDPRFAFLGALPRSAVFAHTVLLAARPRGSVLDHDGSALDQALIAARLINLFVTCFDGICDETPELLPATIPYLDRLFSQFPGDVPAPPVTGHPVIALTHDIAASTARLLIERLGDDECRALATTTIQTAYRRQVETLWVKPEQDVSATRKDLSVATFAVTLLVAAVWSGLDSERTRTLLGAATPVGALFGWVDDVVDLPVDLARGRPNAVLGRSVAKETAARWLAVRDVPERLRAAGITTVEDLDAVLLDAVWAWLGFPDA